MSQYVYAVRFERETPTPFLVSAASLMSAADVFNTMAPEFGRVVSIQEVGPVIIASESQLRAIQ